MFAPDIVFEPTDATVQAQIREAAEEADLGEGLHVGPARPEPMSRRVITVRNDGGPRDRSVDRAYGINVWAESRDVAFDLAEVAQRRLRLAGRTTFAMTRGFTDPVEVPDEIPDTAEVDGQTVTLAHVYFTFVLRTRGRTPQQ